MNYLLEGLNRANRRENSYVAQYNFYDVTQAGKVPENTRHMIFYMSIIMIINIHLAMY
jgi:hypothetical protein